MRQLVLTLLVIGALAAAVLAADDGPKVAHMVYFTLADDTPANREALVAACHEHLSGHDGVFYFSVGTQSDEFQGQVNDRDFDVALHVVFEDPAALATYSKHPRHLTFLRENMAMFGKIRVFDAVLAEAPAGE